MGMDGKASLLLVCPVPEAWSSFPLPSRKTLQASSADKDFCAEHRGIPHRANVGPQGRRNDGNGDQGGCLKGLAAVGMVWSKECRGRVGARPGMGGADIHSAQGGPPEEG